MYEWAVFYLCSFLPQPKHPWALWTVWYKLFWHFEITVGNTRHTLYCLLLGFPILSLLAFSNKIGTTRHTLHCLLLGFPILPLLAFSNKKGTTSTSDMYFFFVSLFKENVSKWVKRLCSSINTIISLVCQWSWVCRAR